MKTIPVRKLPAGQVAPALSGRFSIRSLEQVMAGRDLVHDLHRHDFYFVLAVEHGEGVHEIDFVAYPVHDAAIFILRPGQVHRLELKASATGFLLEFDLELYQPKHSLSDFRWKKITGKNFCEGEAAKFGRLLDYLSAIKLEYDEKSEGYLEAIKANLDLFFLGYLRMSQHPGRLSKPENSYSLDRFEEFRLLLETHIATKKNVSDYTALMNLSAYQLNTITKTAVDKTVSDLINEQILLEAKRYLLATANQVKDIADDLGYEDVSYFIRFFKKHMGLTPDAYRKNFA
jgi:AraC family transcriptional activator of pobA